MLISTPFRDLVPMNRPVSNDYTYPNDRVNNNDLTGDLSAAGAASWAATPGTTCAAVNGLLSCGTASEMSRLPAADKRAAAKRKPPRRKRRMPSTRR